MGMHACLYRSSVGIGGTNVSLTGIPFSFDTLTNNKILMPWDGDMMIATSYALNLASLRLVTPLIQATALDHLRPFGNAATLGNNPNTADFTDFPITLRMTENIDVQATNGDAAAQTTVCIIQLGDRKYSLPSGPTFNIHATGSTTVTAGAWTRVPLVFDDNLPNKLYSIIGGEVFAATGVLGRLNIPNWPMAPGWPVITSLGNRMNDIQYLPQFGELGRFTNQALPALELFSTAADTSQQVWLKIKVIG